MGKGKDPRPGGSVFVRLVEIRAKTGVPSLSEGKFPARRASVVFDGENGWNRKDEAGCSGVRPEVEVRADGMEESAHGERRCTEAGGEKNSSRGGPAFGRLSGEGRVARETSFRNRYGRCRNGREGSAGQSVGRCGASFAEAKGSGTKKLSDPNKNHTFATGSNTCRCIP